MNVNSNVSRYALFLLVPSLLSAGERLHRYALILSDAPLGKSSASASARTNPDRTHHRRIQAAHAAVRAEAARRGLAVTGSIDAIGNAVFVQANPADEPSLHSLPGVVAVQEMYKVKLAMDFAAPLVNAPAAWNALGGIGSSGTGVRIAIIDTGIDQQHPAFQDPDLPNPAGFPVCAGADCSFATSKIIAVRSYVSSLVGSDPAETRPDDLSARDRVGHGTAAAMIAAGMRVTGPNGTITGIAPKAYLGNYKIFGSPGVNDFTFDDVVLTALNDAYKDGMDIASLAIGRSAIWAPADRGNVCGLTPASAACDFRVDAVQTAVRGGLIVIAAAGNDGDASGSGPALGSIHTPGTAPTAITVGSTTNGRLLFHGVTPDGAKQMNALFGEGPLPAQPLTAPLADVSKTGDDGRACAPMAPGSLNGSVALIVRGDCTFTQKINNAQAAGAIAAIIYNYDGFDFVFPIANVQETAIPAMSLGNTDGKTLKTAPAVTLDPSLTSATAAADEIAYFSSQGPSIGENGIKPELVAPGMDMYVATQKFDPNGAMYDSSGFTTTKGTSFSTAIVAGAAALVKQKWPAYNAAQVKSALVNTASGNLTDYDANGNPVQAAVNAQGAGKLNVGEAIKANITADPATLSFGVATAGKAVNISKAVRLYNGSASQIRLTITVTPRGAGATAPRPSSTAVTIDGGRIADLTLQLTGTITAPGSYEGVVTIAGGATNLKLPYLYLVGDNNPQIEWALTGDGFEGLPGSYLPIRLRARFMDQFGVPAAGLPVQFKALEGGGSIDSALDKTDELGITEAIAVAGRQLGPQLFTAEADGLVVEFRGGVSAVPLITANGIMEAAGRQTGKAVAPGSYVSILGKGLSRAAAAATTNASLPLSLANVSVSYDVPMTDIHLPGRLRLVSDAQVDVQIPWELQGQTQVIVKVSIGDISSALYTLALADYSPGIFESADPATGKLAAIAAGEDSSPVTSANPAKAGRPVTLTLNGLGPVDNTPASGEVTPAEPFPQTRVKPIVTIGGRPAEVVSSGLAPGSVGLYRVNLIVPPDAPSGYQPVALSIGGATAKASNIYLQ